MTDTGPSPGPGSGDARNLGAVFVVLADSLNSAHGIVDTMHTLIDAATGFTAAVDAGIVLVDRTGELHVVASTSERAADVEEEQLGTRTGPCFEAFRTGERVEVPDLHEAAERWPDFVAVARAREFRSALALPLRLRDATLGSMNVFSDRVGVFDDADVALLQALADVATIGIVQQQTLHQQTELALQLEHALTSRIVIEQAKGFLAQAHGIPIDDAFGLLRDFARRNRARLADIAEAVIHHRITI